jgi:hypothetical protein
MQYIDLTKIKILCRCELLYNHCESFHLLLNHYFFSITFVVKAAEELEKILNKDQLQQKSVQRQ